MYKNNSINRHGVSCKLIKISNNSSSELDRFYLEIDYSDFKEELLDTDVEDIEGALNYIGSDFNLFKDNKLYDTLDGLSNELVFSINKLSKFQDSTVAKEFKDELYALNTKITNAIDEYNNSKKGA